jgi:hypothetical protein
MEYVAHFKDLNTLFDQEVNYLQTAEELQNLLKSKGAFDTFYIISEH